jgi:hypothetical protein
LAKAGVFRAEAELDLKSGDVAFAEEARQGD